MATGELKVNFNPNPVQRGFIESRAQADLFSSRMGEGKSAGLVWAVYYHTRHNPGANWLIIRDTMENLRDTTMKEFFKWFPPGIFGEFHQTFKTFTWAEGVGQGTVTFVGLDDPNDAGKLQSRELAGFAIDEAAPSANSGGVSEMIFDIGMSRLRQPGMNWYAAKIVENNPDEGHWTYTKFVDPGTDGFRVWQPSDPENSKNLPANYYSELRRLWAHRPDLVRRFIDGRFGFQQIGRSVTPEWDDGIHLGIGLTADRGSDLHLLWDFGLTPTCIVTQISPMRHWNILDAFVGEDVGIEELCDNTVIPLLSSKYDKFRWKHIGDPAGTTREASAARMSAARMIVRKLGGTWRSGPKRINERVDPLRAVLTKQNGGRGLVQVDRISAVPVWHALRGGWHYHVARTGLISAEPFKDKHSHPGDAMGYGAAVLFPLVKPRFVNGAGGVETPMASAWTPSTIGGQKRASLGFERPGTKVPKHGGGL